MIKKDVLTRVEEALQVLKKGQLIIVADDVEREGEGDMVGLAEHVTPENVNSMISHARGLLCVPMSLDLAKKLGLHSMTDDSTDAFGTAFTVSTDAKSTTTGISAYDRAKTIKQLVDPLSKYDDFYHPGHIFPLIAKKGGVLERPGHTEAAVDLAKLANSTPAAYIMEILKKNGKMARKKDLKSLAEGLQMPLITVKEIKYYRLLKDQQLVKSVAKVNLPTKYGNFNLEAFETPNSQEPTLLISKGQLKHADSLLLRLHSECLTGDVFGSLRCDCGDQLIASLQQIEKKGSGAVLYLRQEGRGIGLTNKLKAYMLQEAGLDTVDANLKLGFQADERKYDIAAAILKQKGISKVELLTNNPDKITQLTKYGIHIEKRIPLEMNPNDNNLSYLKTKKQKMHHLLMEV
ncbi:3,4-dihydroxy-2-butanone-4-phosphate synthase [Pediococcus acidilactici]|uniref:bifunctional 3,4-dihydroxy-2-butanone-4-phosphate synthase/GTP cyclohydrolase II n=1 Tax=Pediococcus acidilactici TaxID=1254 RepID=UPI0007EF04E7|nr:bifunctional 3,4-dihydroxy-2-butanone-4-phosphate synthase/GTP cyclohydrolase II [Pediococcus acidilactici]ARW24409.1 3,4-dihydroxy-2-butanone-4-phosphate synthase [Pediococcus acidilactici]ARW26444.1 3,4-dihydroxy-2-butanone-4-phosphate synthase [Pediococcus acidilactici]ARW28527.1 3,4-dihydroxy-2-butanone-4-phosphate synthase [Pediococcus acidilactici]OBR30724.1 3,4-dihydroxy-2-butanone-4-phosphate synthase [Pediococcus acidilactici]WDA28890.1 bifunctional 3,4-dihydroxy-2-butanone-4-phosp